jgi:hypothetical protein
MQFPQLGTASLLRWEQQWFGHINPNYIPSTKVNQSPFRLILLDFFGPFQQSANLQHRRSRLVHRFAYRISA